MKTIYKCVIGPETFNRGEVYLLPEGANPICMQPHNGDYSVWFEVDDKKPKTYYILGQVGTGIDFEGLIPDHAKYIGTFQTLNGTIVHHVYGWPEQFALTPIRAGSQRQ